MGKTVDPYYEWLGIPPKDQPPNHYRLLGIELFEANPNVIDAAANRQMGFVKEYQTGPDCELSQHLLNELSAARLCLLNPANKAIYDSQLQAKPEARWTGPSPSDGASRWAGDASPTPVVPPPVTAAANLAAVDPVASPVNPEAVLGDEAEEDVDDMQHLPPWLWAAGGFAAGAAFLCFGVILLLPSRYGSVKVELSRRTTKPEIALDGHRIDVSALVQPLRLKAGAHAIVVKADGFEDVTRSFRVKAGAEESLHISLVPKAVSHDRRWPSSTSSSALAKDVTVRSPQSRANHAPGNRVAREAPQNRRAPEPFRSTGAFPSRNANGDDSLGDSSTAAEPSGPKVSPPVLNPREVFKQLFGRDDSSQPAMGPAPTSPAGMGQPGMGQPGMGQPGMGQPGMGQPGMGQPGMGQPGMGQPGMGQPGMGQPGMRQPGMGQPGMGQPGMGQPGMGQPGMGQPGGSGTVAPGGSGTMAPGGSGTVAPGGSGTMAPGGSGTVAPGGSGTVAPGGSGTVAPGGSGTMGPGGSGTMGPGGSGTMGPGGSGTMGPGGSGTMAPGGSGTMAPGGSGTMAPGVSPEAKRSPVKLAAKPPVFAGRWWTRADGSSRVYGTYVRIHQGQVIVAAGNRVHQIPTAELSQRDQQYLRQNGIDLPLPQSRSNWFW
jgi:hypothetical protein